MQMGFMSLILTVTQRSISNICIPNKFADSMLPCRRQSQTKTTKAIQHLFSNKSQHQRILAAAPSNSTDHCGSQVNLILLYLRVIDTCQEK